ncbi:MAG: DUF507 domain-containing protein [Desulfuromonas sp.]|nr:MAG: DUF507 domain-containing protein [Desulfuromonas sp.]
MRLNDEQIIRLANGVFDALSRSGQMTLKAEQGLVVARLAETIREDLAGEQGLDEEARKLLDAHLAKAPPGVDRQKLFIMIKQKLAQERGIEL